MITNKELLDRISKEGVDMTDSSDLVKNSSSKKEPVYTTKYLEESLEEIFKSLLYK